MTNTVVDINSSNKVGGPGELVDQSKETPFVLSKKEWLSIQRYVAHALALPISEAQMRLSLGMGALEDVSKFMDIVNGYGQGEGKVNGYRDMYKHCQKWKKETYPFIVSLAHDIRHYANDVPEYYEAIIEIVAELKKSSRALKRAKRKDPEAAEELNELINELKLDLKDLLEDRIEEAKSYSDNANKAYEMVSEFAENSGEDYKDLQQLLKKYKQQYGDKSEYYQELSQEIEALQKAIEELNEEYDHAVTVAATSPTYAWVFPFGTIAAGVVAGIFSDKAVKLKKRINETRDKMKEQQAQVQQILTMQTYLQRATQGMQSISDDLKAALPTIGKIKGIWETIAKDLGNINTNLDEVVGNEDEEKVVPPALQKVKLNAAKKQWTKVEAAADGFVVNAYIEVTDEQSASQTAVAAA